MELKGKRVLVLGMAKSGLAAARFLAARGARVLISDSRPASELTSSTPASRRMSQSPSRRSDRRDPSRG